MANLDRHRFLFRAIVQHESESFEAYYEKLKAKVIKCKYEDPEEQLFDRILQTCCDQCIVEKACESDLTLTQLVAVAKSLEEAKKNSNNLLTPSSSKQDFRTTSCCSRCGSKDSDHSLENCVAYRSKILCDSCKRRGHFEIMCHHSRGVTNEATNLKDEPKYEAKIEDKVQGNCENETTNFISQS